MVPKLHQYPSWGSLSRFWNNLIIFITHTCTPNNFTSFQNLLHFGKHPGISRRGLYEVSGSLLSLKECVLKDI